MHQRYLALVVAALSYVAPQVTSADINTSCIITNSGHTWQFIGTNTEAARYQCHGHCDLDTENGMTTHFFCIEYQLNSGIKEDCFGFYPKTASGMFVGGPGVAESEFRKNPVRFANVVSSFKSGLTDFQRRAIYKLVDAFNQKNYSLIDSN